MENNLNQAGGHCNEREWSRNGGRSGSVGGLAAVCLTDFMVQLSRPAGGWRAVSRAAHTETWH